ncbi:hypothetical protein M3194_13150 [Paenibacillus glycanilyticus]|uniref:hypothetical protein n=1 Tax=Paenibacillus glycanilyticus TaxID=126569 RepID=UPI00203A7427|nr:hypothetical protein [Paenibacillus glycanilyticus]MCM3628313.1 hypothetical protein [Paenibacillus glycanilyticus]
MIAYIMGYVLIVVLWITFRIRSLLGNQKNKEAMVISGILVISLLIGSLLIGRVRLPSFVLVMQILLEPVGKYLLKQ